MYGCVHVNLRPLLAVSRALSSCLCEPHLCGVQHTNTGVSISGPFHKAAAKEKQPKSIASLSPRLH